MLPQAPPQEKGRKKKMNIPLPPVDRLPKLPKIQWKDKFPYSCVFLKYCIYEIKFVQSQ